jgi:predicted flap endonuclease-1-like 5' DNA nuclease
MTYAIEEIEGIGATHGKTLRAAGIASTEALLDACGDRKGRTATAEKTGIDAKRLLEWANRADLMRVRGIGSEFSDLLEAAGVDTVKELATRNAANLAVKLAEVNSAKKLTRAVPGEIAVAGWIEQAKALPAMISH